MLHRPKLRGYQCTPEGIYLPERGGNVCSLGMGHGHGHGLSKPQGTLDLFAVTTPAVAGSYVTGPAIQITPIMPTTWVFWVSTTAAFLYAFTGWFVGGTNPGWYVVVGDMGVRFRSGVGDTSFYLIQFDALPAGITINDGDWHCVVVSAAVGGAGAFRVATTKIWVDGVLATPTVTTKDNAQNGSMFDIATNLFARADGNAPVVGKMAQTAIWNRALSDVECASIYANRYADFSTLLVDAPYFYVLGPAGLALPTIPDHVGVRDMTGINVTGPIAATAF